MTSSSILHSHNIPMILLVIGMLYAVGVVRCYLEAQDDGPDEAEHQAVVPVHDVVRAHVLQVNPLLLQELQRFVHVLQAVDTHPAFGGLGLKQKHKRNI